MELFQSPRLSTCSTLSYRFATPMRTPRAEGMSGRDRILAEAANLQVCAPADTCIMTIIKRMSIPVELNSRLFSPGRLAAM